MYIKCVGTRTYNGIKSTEFIIQMFQHIRNKLLSFYILYIYVDMLLCTTVYKF